MSGAKSFTFPPRCDSGYTRCMALALSIFGIAFAAFCVWLGVRIVNRRERWVKWTAAGLLVATFVVYPLSIGPVEWLRHEQLRRQGYMVRSIWQTTLSFYAPLVWVYSKVPRPIRGPMDWYADFWH